MSQTNNFYIFDKNKLCIEGRKGIKKLSGTISIPSKYLMS